MLPSGLGAPSDVPTEPPNSADPNIRWLQPVPDRRVAADDDDPATIVGGRDSVRLALIVSLQYLPPRQRAVLILREVLAWSAAEVGALLDMSIAAVKSSLQRARARLDEVAPSADQPTALTEREQHELLNQYIAAFEAADPRQRAAGRRRLPSDADGSYVPYGIVVLTAGTDGISAITAFGAPELVTAFGFPPTLPASDPASAGAIDVAAEASAARRAAVAGDLDLAGAAARSLPGDVCR